METKTITPTLVTPKEVNTKFGKKVVFEIKADDGETYSCWDKDFVNALNLDTPIEINFEVSQNGRYTSRTISTGKKGRKFLNEEDVQRIVDEAKKDILAEIENLKKLINI